MTKTTKTTINAGGQSFEVVVAYISEFPRGKDGTCALCQGDPCAEDKSRKKTLIKKYYKENPNATTCPCCNGRPT